MIWSFWVAFRHPGCTESPQKKRPGVVLHDPNPTRMQETLRGKFRWGEIQNGDVGCVPVQAAAVGKPRCMIVDLAFFAFGFWSGRLDGRLLLARRGRVYV